LALVHGRSKSIEGSLGSISVFACESQPIVVEGLQRVLADCDDLVFSGWASKAADALEAIQRVRPDVVLIDGSRGRPSSPMTARVAPSIARVAFIALCWLARKP
jgi:DNA-binding NarL/FixJ family response regulator